MQERRSTIRIPCPIRAQYCPSDDLLPRDGRLLNISERGAGLQAREAHRAGERMTLSWTLPGEEEPLTATGVVRWAGTDGRMSRWHPLGLEWLPLEETVRHRLNAFVSDHAKTAAPRAGFGAQGAGQRAAMARLIVRAGLVFGALLCLFFGLWVTALQRQNQDLTTAVEQRNAVVSHLEAQHAAQQQQLEQTRTSLAVTTEEVLRLDQETQRLTTDVHRLTQGMDVAQQSYVQVQQEREALMRRVLDLEQERLLLQRKLSSVPELRRAIHDAVRSRKQWERAQHRRRLGAARAESRARLASGNRGYLVRDGQPTVDHSTVWIRVHDPEPWLAPQDASQ